MEIGFNTIYNKENIEKKILVKSFKDTHLHLVEYGKRLKMTDLRHVSSIEDMIGILKGESEKNKIEAYGWNQENFIEKRDPNRYDLDKIAKDRPVLLSRICAHVTVVNSYVIQALGLDKHIPKIEGGQIDISEDGTPTGIFREKARILLYEYGFYDEALKDIKGYILDAQADLLKKGITEVHVEDCNTFPNISWQHIIDAYLELEQEDKLILKVNFQANVLDVKALVAYRKKMVSNKIVIGSVKRFVDGSLGARTAHLRTAYSDDIHTSGIQLQSDEALREDFLNAYNYNMPLSIHAIGDRAIERVLDALESLRAPHYYYQACGIIHCQITSPDLIERIHALGIRAYIQPIFIHEDAKIVYDRLGEKRASQSYVFKTMYDRGIPLYMGSDAPIDTPDVIKGLYCAVMRKTLDETPIEYLPHQGLSLDDALNLYTSDWNQGWILLDMPLDEALKTPSKNHVLKVWLDGVDIV